MVAAWRAELFLVDRLVLSERGLEARDESVVDRALGEEDRLGTLFPGGELHRRRGAPVGPGRTARILGIDLGCGGRGKEQRQRSDPIDRKSTRLNSSH